MCWGSVLPLPQRAGLRCTTVLRGPVSSAAALAVYPARSRSAAVTLTNPEVRFFRASRRICAHDVVQRYQFQSPVPNWFQCPKSTQQQKSFRKIICKNIYRLAWRGGRRAELSSCECPSALGRARADARLSKHCVHVLGTIPAPCSLVTGCARHVPAGTAGPSGHLLSTRASRDHHGPKPNQQQQLCLPPKFLAVVV